MANLSNINGKFVVEQTTGYVGVGTTDPNFLIEAAGANSEIALNSTSASIYRLRSTSSDSFIITKNGVGDRLVIDGSGNSTFSGSVIANNYISIKTASSSGSPYIDFIQNTTQKAYIQFNDGANALNFQSDNAFTFIGGSVERVRIDGSGNVGIGTTSPLFKLQTNATITGSWLGYLNGTSATFGTNNFSAVHSSTAIGTGTESGINLANNASDVGAPSPIISFSAKSASANYQHAYAAIYGIKTATGADTNWNEGDLVLATSDGTGPKERIRIDSSGNVGIGTTSPLHNLQIGTAATNGSYSMMIEGNFGNTALSSNPRLNLIDTNFGITAGKYGSGTSDDAIGIFAFQGAGRGILFAHTTAGSGTHLKDMRHDMFIAGGTGNVGIGTVSPNDKLNVQSDALGSAVGSQIRQAVFSANDGNTTHLEIKNIRTSTVQNWTGAAKRIQCRVDSSYMGYIQFNGTGNVYGISFGTGGTTTAPGNVPERMVINQAGNVGIGTTSPGAKLDIAVVPSAPWMKLTNENEPAFNLTTYNNGTNNGSTVYAFKHGLYYGGTENATIAFYRGPSSVGGFLAFTTDNGTERMRITSGGGVFIADDQSSNAKLYIKDTKNGSESSPHFQIKGNGYDAYHFLNTTAYYIVQNSAGRSLRIVSSSNGVKLDPAATAWTSNSDIALKENIKPLENVLDKIKDYRCVEYNLKTDDDKKIGFIAQDWENDFAPIVNKDENEMLGMKYTETIPILLKAIQELKADNDSLKARIETLENN